MTHWTATSVDDFVHRLSFDFITQLAKRLEALPDGRAEFRKRLGLTNGRVSQILNDTSNLTLRKAVEYAKAAGMKVSVVAYHDDDPDNNNGPVNSEIFSRCWEKAGRPLNFSEVERLPHYAGFASTFGSVVIPNRKSMYITGQRIANAVTIGDVWSGQLFTTNYDRLLRIYGAIGEDSATTEKKIAA